MDKAFPFLLVFGLTSIFASMGAMFELMENRSQCTYQSLAAYHPARVLVCELFLKRWPS
jgi:hypothetical protein